MNVKNFKNFVKLKLVEMNEYNVWFYVEVFIMGEIHLGFLQY